ncbi:YopX family protein [Liquorilactobacillus nagelii]|uniref:YopX family protein n=1 Tax=Liquorilactobacillus nagelii TaxID=82688 RepID=UPI0039ED26DE
MREIEFRAWDKETKIMRYMDELGGICLAALVASELIIEQFTGLKDPNCKKIFEGDILENKKYRSIVEFRGCAFSAKVIFDSKQTGQYFDLRGETSVSKKVGNIHENQELLDTRKEVK